MRQDNSEFSKHWPFCKSITDAVILRRGLVNVRGQSGNPVLSDWQALWCRQSLGPLEGSPVSESVSANICQALPLLKASDHREYAERPLGKPVPGAATMIYTEESTLYRCI